MSRRMKVINALPDRRDQEKQRILWVVEESFLSKTDIEDRRTDVDTKAALGNLLASTKNREIGGIVFATIRRDGKIDYGAAGLAYDCPVLASGLAARLQAMLDGWMDHPGIEVV